MTGRSSLLSVLANLCIVLSVGCSSDTGPELAEVSGTVTLDGQPLAKASLQFIPEQSNSSPSYGVTNADGEYELLFSVGRSGAMPGKHRVEIHPVEPEVDQNGKPVDGVTTVKLPRKYSVPGNLSAEIHAGSNTVNFTLDSK